MNHAEREVALQKMDETIRRFYSAAQQIGNRPFVEFAGVMTAYLKACQRAHEDGIDFSKCNRPTGQPLPMEKVEVDYLREKLECIFDGRITAVDAVASK